MKSLLSILILTGIVLPISTCKKIEVPISPIPETIKYYVDFEPGSYWVYKDSLTGFIDSIVLLDKNTTYVNEDNEYRSETIEYTCYSSFLKDNFKATLISGQDSTISYYTREIDYAYPTYSTIHLPGTYPSKEFDTLTVGAIDFYKVKSFNGSPRFYSYFAKHVGLIKLNFIYDIWPKHNWQLIRYKVQ